MAGGGDTPTPMGTSASAGGFQLATPHQVDSAGTPTPGLSVNPTPTQAPGTKMTGLPSWLSSFFDGNQSPVVSGTPTAVASPTVRRSFVPGTSMSGYGQSRPAPTFMPPNKPTALTNADSNTAGLVPVPKDPGDLSFNYTPNPQWTPQQNNMAEWDAWNMHQRNKTAAMNKVGNA